jgi:hypothetical protein
VKIESPDVVCSFCDRKAADIAAGSVFNREGRAAICTDCIQVCIEILCERSTCVDFKPRARGKTHAQQDGA